MRTVLLAALIIPVCAQAQSVTEMTPNRAYRGALPASNAIWTSYRLVVGPGVGELELDLDATGDADLYVRRGQTMGGNWRQSADLTSNGDGGRESIRLTTADGLCACTYYIDVVHGGGVLGDRLKYTLRSRTSEGMSPPAVAGTPTDVESTFSDDFRTNLPFGTEGLNYRTYVIDVDRDVEQLELQLRGAGGDLDLYARHGAPMPDWSSAHHMANSTANDETLVISRDGAPQLRTGQYFVDVANPDGWSGNAQLIGRMTRGYSGPEATGRLPEPSRLDDVSGEIRENSEWTVSLDEGPRYRTYVIEVPAGRKSIMVRATGANGDIDLYLRHNASMEDYAEEPDHAANSVRADEQLYVDSRSSPALRPGRYYFDIARTSADIEYGPIQIEVEFDGPKPEPLPATSGPLRELEIGERVSVDLYDTGDRGARFRFEVPNSAQTLDVRVLGASRDVDLFLRKDTVITSHTDETGYDIQSVTTRLNERIELARNSTPALTPGVWYLDVASLVGSDERIAFDLVVAVDGEVEGDRIDFPPYFRNADLTPLERSGQAIVQVSSESGSGSGTMLSADGYLMTNHHVVEDEGVVQEDDIFISFITDFDEPPQQIFVAEVVEYDAELDLALLKITRDIYDRPLPANLHLPYMELGDPNAMRHGDLLYIAGYPSVGGFESRSSLSVTRGIVSGFINDVDGEREWIKTDARINAGNSGGTAMDLNFLYVGVPSRERIAEDDELGYSRPVNTIPDEWKALFQTGQ